MRIISFMEKIIDFFYDQLNNVPDDIWSLIKNIICFESEKDVNILLYV